MRIRLGTLAAACIVASVAALAPVLPAAAGCYKSSCNGGNPQAAGCASGATTVSSKYMTDNNGNHIGLVEERWSGACVANWTRVTSYIGNEFIESFIGVSGGGQGYTFDTSQAAAWGEPSPNTYIWGPMLNGVTVNQSCGDFYNVTPDFCPPPV